MKSILELLYHITEKSPVSNPYYDAAQKQWDALEPALSLDVVDTAYRVKEEWGFSCFAAGLQCGLALARELDQLGSEIGKG